MVERDLRVSEASNAHHRLGVAAFRVRAGEALRFCPDCLAGQVRDLGVPTWLIAHQLPGVLVCPTHGTWLVESLVTRATAGRHGYVVPTGANCATRGPGDQIRVGETAKALLLDLSRTATALSAAMRPARQLDHWRDHYVARLAGVGLMRSARKVDQVALNEGLFAYWGAALPCLPSPCSSLGENGWAAAMVRSHRKAMHPLFHLLLDGFLVHLERGGRLPTLTGQSVAVYDVRKAAGEVLTAHAASTSGRAPRVDWGKLDVRLCGAIRSAADDIRAASPPVRVSTAEIERRVARVDWLGKRRRKLPDAMRALADAQEPLAAYQRRRAVHWVEVLGPSCRPWEVMRAAGLRSEQLPMIQAAMAARAAASAAR